MVPAVPFSDVGDLPPFAAHDSKEIGFGSAIVCGFRGNAPVLLLRRRDFAVKSRQSLGRLDFLRRRRMVSRAPLAGVDRCNETKSSSDAVASLLLLVSCHLLFTNEFSSLLDFSHGCFPSGTHLAAFFGIVMVVAAASLGSNRAILYVGRNSLYYFAIHQRVVIATVQFRSTDWECFRKEQPMLSAVC